MLKFGNGIYSIITLVISVSAFIIAFFAFQMSMNENAPQITMSINEKHTKFTPKNNNTIDCNLFYSFTNFGRRTADSLIHSFIVYNKYGAKLNHKQTSDYFEVLSTQNINNNFLFEFQENDLPIIVVMGFYYFDQSNVFGKKTGYEEFFIRFIKHPSMDSTYIQQPLSIKERESIKPTYLNFLKRKGLIQYHELD